jgi:hypothetical protein
MAGFLEGISRFEWDAEKRDANLRKHGIDFVDVMVALDGWRIIRRSDRNGEVRYLSICEVQMRLVTVVYTLRDDACRIISARAARKYEKEQYHAIFG